MFGVKINNRVSFFFHPLNPPPAGDIPRTRLVKGKVGGFSPAGGGLRGWMIFVNRWGIFIAVGVFILNSWRFHKNIFIVVR